MSRVRGRGGRDAGLPSPPVGALLRWVAAVLGARNVVEVGAGTGFVALALLRGMDERGTVTSIASDPDEQALARRAHEDAGETARVRSIVGDPPEVLARLADDGYDLVVVQDYGSAPLQLLDELLRVLSDGGVLIALRTSHGAAGGDPRRRQLVQRLIDRDNVEVALLPVDAGVLLAVVRDQK